MEKNNCLICNKKFIDNTNNLIKKYCSSQCKKIRDKNSKRILPDKIKKNCKICNVIFIDTSWRKHKKYCSIKCRNKFKMNNPARKLFIKKYKQNGRRKQVLKKYYNTDNGKRVRSSSVALRHARKLRAIPKWVGPKEIKEMREIYKKRKPGYHVDHIIPLKNDYVCGLHVPNNLNILTAKDNILKSNKFIPGHNEAFYNTKYWKNMPT